MVRVQLDADEVTPAFPRREQARPGTAERIEQQASGGAERGDEGFQDEDGFLRPMQPLAGVAPRQHARQRMCGQGRAALGQHIGALMPRLGEPR